MFTKVNKDQQKMKITFLGTRGTIPVDGKKYELFGGATLCVLVQYEQDIIILDAGTGLLCLEDHIDTRINKELHILLSHSHLDHIIGLLGSNLLFDPSITVNIYSAQQTATSIKKGIDTLMNKHIWPVNSDIFKAKMNYINIPKKFSIGNFTITEQMGKHIGYSSVFRVECENKSLVYATDYELDTNSINDLADFSKKTDILICDGQYSELTHKSGFGHSTWNDAISVADKAKAEKLCIIHHDPYNTDLQLLDIESQVKQHNENYFLAKRGATISL